jgi:hypothetical protein
MRRQVLQPIIEVLQESILGIVYKHSRSDMHGVDEAEALPNAAFPYEVFDGAGNIDKAASARDFEPQMFGERFHS